MARLEQENRRLQEFLSSLQRPTANNSNDASSSSKRENLINDQAAPEHRKGQTTTKASTPWSVHAEVQGPPIPTPTPTSLSSGTTAVQQIFSRDQDSCNHSHGPTSAVFDEQRSRREGLLGHNVPDVWVSRQLVAESAKQRQLETVNYLAGKFDFDGVDPGLGMHLLSIYWNRQQSLGPLIYRTAFMRDMACAGPNFSNLLLNAIYFYASKFSPRLEVCREPGNRLTAGWIYRQRATELLGRSFDKSTITTIQALLLMSSALFSWCDEKSLSWLYGSMAYNMIIDLGMHVDAATSGRRFTSEESEVRLRCFWAAYVNDKLLSLYQGRPACLHEFVTNLPITFLDEHDELESFNPESYTVADKLFMSPVYSISTFKETCKLSTILDRILLLLYTEKSPSKDPEYLLRKSNTVHAELRDWRNSLPRHLDLRPDEGTMNPLPHTLSLLAMFNVLVILLHRPFVSDGHLHPSSSSSSSSSSSVVLEGFAACSSAAFEIDQILQTYEKYFCFSASPHMISYATYVSATIHVRLAAQRPRGSDAHKALRRCLDILDIQQSVCWSPRRAKRVIMGLVSRMGVIVDEDAGEQALLPDATDIILSDLDIGAIMRTFAPDDLPPAEGLVNTSTLPTTTTSDLLNHHPTALEDTTTQFFYDPIFGFNGTSLDDFDIVFDNSDVLI